MRRSGLALAVAAAVAGSLALHALILAEPARPFAAAVVWVMAIAAALALARGVGLAEAAAVVGPMTVAWYLSAGTPYTVFLPSIAWNLLLLWFFGRTLVPGREPLVTAIARLIRGSLAAELERYSRRVTWAWCVFFAAMAATSCVLAELAPLAVWSFFANVLELPLVALMFVAEYAYRRRRFPALEHVPPLVLFRRMRNAGYFGSAPSPK